MIIHIFRQGDIIFQGTRFEDSWMLYHDHLKIFWETTTIEWLKNWKCPIQGNPNRSWYDRIIKLSGSYNDKVAAAYKHTLPGDSPEVMSLDNHLFADLEECNTRNIAFSFHLPEGDPMKYSSSTPHRLWNSLTRTLYSCKVPTAERIIEDMHRIPQQTLQRIIDAKGCYIEDKTGKKSRKKGVRSSAQQAYRERKAEKLSVLDDTLVDAMMHLHAKVANKEVSCPLIFAAGEATATEEEGVDEDIVYDEAEGTVDDDIGIDNSDLD
jgi:hypothetical protein